MTVLVFDFLSLLVYPAVPCNFDAVTLHTDGANNGVVDNVVHLGSTFPREERRHETISKAMPGRRRVCHSPALRLVPPSSTPKRDQISLETGVRCGRFAVGETPSSILGFQGSGRSVGVKPSPLLLPLSSSIPTEDGARSNLVSSIAAAEGPFKRGGGSFLQLRIEN